MWRQRSSSARAIGLLVRLTAAAVLLLLTSCRQMLGLTDAQGLGALTIRVADSTEKTIEPPIGLTIASYDVYGTGPSGATFFTGFTGSSVTLTGLVSGEWSIAVDGKNAADDILTHGEANATIDAGSTRTVDIATTAVAGIGNLELTVTWAPESVDNPSIHSQLVTKNGSPMDLEFAIIAPGVAMHSSLAIEGGYYTLTVQLLDGGQLAMGAVDVVRIVKGQTTTGTIDFPDVNAGAGSIIISITPEMHEPVSVSLNGHETELGEGQPMTVSASVPPGLGAATFVWYLSGVSVATGPTCTLNTAVGPLNPGPYRLDVTAFVASGARGGSSTCTFEVFALREVTLEWDPNTEAGLAGYKLYVGTASGVYGEPIDVGLVTSYTVTGLLSQHTYYFALTAYNTTGTESVKSGEVVYTAP